jgi:hypothetical protein
MRAEHDAQRCRWLRVHSPDCPGEERAVLAHSRDRGYAETARSLRLAAQDVALSRRKQGFESPRERQAPFPLQ